MGTPLTEKFCIASRIAKANSATCLALWTERTGQPPTAKNASPIVSTLYNPNCVHKGSNNDHIESKALIKNSGVWTEDISVNPTTSLKKTVTSLYNSEGTFSPLSIILAMGLGKSSHNNLSEASISVLLCKLIQNRGSFRYSSSARR
eukprot:Lithocolla_globosa_v1_NODE_1937_length_2251_cov_7.638434.p2 type:complete len:147 gc:universal NODE_1937_length_2251_cov_7.638434:719-1159(+)